MRPDCSWEELREEKMASRSSLSFCAVIWGVPRPEGGVQRPVLAAGGGVQSPVVKVGGVKGRSSGLIDRKPPGEEPRVEGVEELGRRMEPIAVLVLLRLRFGSPRFQFGSMPAPASP